MSPLLKFAISLPLLATIFSASAADIWEGFVVKDGEKIQLIATYKTGELYVENFTDNKEGENGDKDLTTGWLKIIVPGEYKLGDGTKLESKVVKLLNADNSVQGILKELNLSSLADNFPPINLPIFETPISPLVARIDFASLSNVIQGPTVGSLVSITNGVVPNVPGMSLYVLPNGQTDFFDESFFLTAETFTGSATVTSLFTTSPVPEPTTYLLFLIGLTFTGFAVGRSRRIP